MTPERLAEIEAVARRWTFAGFVASSNSVSGGTNGSVLMTMSDYHAMCDSKRHIPELTAALRQAWAEIEELKSKEQA